MTVAPESPTLLDPLLDEAPAPALFAAGAAAPERTLLDILDETARRHPDAPAVDDGTAALSYRALLAEVERGCGCGSPTAGIGVGDRVGVRVPSGTADLYVAILAVLAAGAAYVPVDADDPDERAELVFAEAGGRRRASAPGATIDGARRPAARAPRQPARARRRRVDHLHLRLHRQAQGRRGHPPQRRRVRRRRGPAVPAPTSRSAPATGCWPGCRWPSTPPARRCGWPGGTAPAWCPRRARWCAPAWTSGPWLVEQGITVVSTVPTLAALWPAEALDDVRLLIFGGEACPPELAERLAVDGPRGVEHLRPHRGDRRRVRRAADRRGAGTDRAAAGRLGAGRGRTPRGDRSAMGETGELVIGGVGLARYLDPAKDAEKYAPLPRSAGTAPTAAATWSAPSRTGCSSSAGPTSRSSSAAGGSSSARSTRRCRRCRASPGAAAAVRTTGGGPPAAGRLRRGRSDGFDRGAGARDRLRASAARRAGAAARRGRRRCPTRTSGKVDRDALPWPLPSRRDAGRRDRRASPAPRRGWPSGGPSVLGVAAGGPRRRLLRRAAARSLAAARLVSASCGPATRRGRSATSTSTRRWRGSPERWPRSTRPSRAHRATSRRCRARAGARADRC